MRSLLRWTGIIAGSLAALWFVSALVMIVLPAPSFARPAPPARVLEPDASAEAARESNEFSFTMRDGVALHALRFGSESPLTVVFLHGVMSDSREYAFACERLRRTTGADVYAIDLRGHGKSGGRPGDVDYRDQYEDDVTDVLAALHKQKPNGVFILAGHSMGGGIAMRYAETRRQPRADGYLLFAPHLGVSSPTTPTEDKPLPAGQEAIVRLDLLRTLGLVMLDTSGVHALDGLNTLFFNAPPTYPIHAYSFRAMVSMAPADYRQALGADAAPLFAIAGSSDEAFVASRYPSVIKMHRSGSALIIPGVTHDGIVRSGPALDAAARWMRSHWSPAPV